jgi:hypothetical protein
MAGSIYVPILSSFNPAGVNNARKSLGGLAGAFDGVKRSLGLASAGFVAFRAISETIDFGRSSILAARDLERNLIGLDAVFDELSPRMERFAAEGVAIGLSQSDAAKATTFLGSVLKQAGFGMEDVASQTENLVSLASDLAFTYGYDVSEALSGMTALFRGEYDPIEKFGVAMKQSEVNAVLAANGQGQLAGAARRTAEQMARLALLYQRTEDAQGAFKEGAGSLFVEQQKLQAIFGNLQAEVGAALIPALVKVAEALQPLVKTLAPVITELFVQFAGIVDVLGKQLEKLRGSFAAIITVFGFLFSVLKNILPLLIDNAAAILTFIVAFKGIVTLTPIVQGFIVQLALLRMEMAAGTSVAALFGATTAASLGPLTLIAAGVALFAGGLVVLGIELAKASDKTKELDTSFNQFKKSAENDPFKQLTASTLGYGIALQDVINKKSVLGGARATNSELLASNYGAGAGGAIIGKADKTAVDDFQNTLKDLLKNFSGAVTETKKTAGATSTAAKKLIDEQAASLKKQQDALDSFKKSIQDLLPALKPLAVAAREIGQFEQETIDSFENLTKKVDEAFREGIITQGASRELNAYLAVEKQAFIAINRQRDELVKKRGLAETLISDIKAAIIGVGSLAGLLETETRQVTTATTKIVDGFTITTKRTVDEIVGGQGVLSKLSAVVAKTKAFAGQLTQLRKLGLNENLFKQVVEAGPDVGGQLAVEILAGGADAVGALNTTFRELEDVAGQVAEQTAQVMYGSGVDVSNGLVAGLLAQEQALVAAAETLANAFITAFNALMAKIQIPSLSNDTVTNAGGFAYNNALAGVSGDDSQFGMGTPWAQTIAKFRESERQQTVVNLTVNAGMGTDGKAVGQKITSLLNQYTRSNA